MSSENKIIRPDWFDWPHIQTFCRLCAAHNLAIRFVGGCVRDTLMQREVHDIDVATSALPADMIKVFSHPPYKAIATGLSHGTVTIVIDSHPIEVTTLRHDLACDGRHAVVAFTDSWREDALRRDFTMNALMLSPDGTLYDEVGGINDIRRGCVRFIGDPLSRIQEDGLRILRFFRFLATHATSAPDTEALDACRTMAPMLEDLSAERIAQEMLKLLAAPDPVTALQLMLDYDVITLFAEATPDIQYVEKLIEYERVLNIDPDALLRLVMLYGTTSMNIAKRWKLSVRQQELVILLCQAAPLTTAQQVMLFLYTHGRHYTTLCVMRDIVRHQAKPSLMDSALRADIPVFPLSGKDLLAQGYIEGAALGATLQTLEQQWMTSGFTLDKTSLLKSLPYNKGSR